MYFGQGFPLPGPINNPYVHLFDTSYDSPYLVPSTTPDIKDLILL